MSEILADRHPIHAVILVFFCIAVASCGDDETTAERTPQAQRDSPLPQVFAYPADPPAFPVTPLYVYGGEARSEDETFGLITDVSLDREGTVYVLDRGFGRVAVISPAGELVRTFGRKGAGPGEFDVPVSLSVRASHIFVLDAGLRRVSVFSLEGEFLRSGQVPVMLSSSAELEAAGEDRAILSSSSTIVQPGERLEEHSLHILDLDSGDMTLVLSRRYQIQDAIRWAGSTHWLLRPYVVRRVWAWSPSEPAIVTGDPSDSFTLSAYDLNDRAESRRIRIQKPPRIVTEQDRQSTLAAWKQVDRGPDWDAVASHARFPAVMPYYEAVLVDRVSGLIWCERFVKPEIRVTNPEMSYDLLSWERGVVGSCSIPFWVSAVSGDRVVCYSRDPETGDSIHLYRVLGLSEDAADEYVDVASLGALGEIYRRTLHRLLSFE